MVADGLERDQSAIGTAAACSKVRLGGLGARRSSDAAAYSAYEPSAEPKTSSPGANPEMLSPTASMTPAMSVPRTGFFGLRSP